MAAANRRSGGRGAVVARRPIDFPAGDERREAMRQSADGLAAQVEAMPEGGPISTKAFKVENEIAQHFNLLDVTNADPVRRYAWVYLGQHGLQVKMKLADGWQVIQGDDLESAELKGIGSDTTRKLGDVMLMWIPVDRYVLLQRREARKRDLQEQGVAAQFEEILRPYKQYGATAIVNGVDVMTGQPIDSKRLDHMWKSSQAQARGTQIVDKMLRDGAMPGVPA